MNKLMSILLALLVSISTAYGQAADSSGIVAENMQPVSAASLESRFSPSDLARVPAGTPCKIYPGTSATLVRIIDGDKAIIAIGLVSGAQAKRFLENAKKRFTTGLAKEDRQCVKNAVVAKSAWDAMVAANRAALNRSVKK